MRPTKAVVKLSALRHNLARVRQYAPQAKVLAIVKADAYGHGLLRLLPGLTDADGLGVLRINEALLLREAGYRRPILLLEGVFSADELHTASAHDISIVVHHQQHIAMLQSCNLAKPLSIFLKMNSGMNRLGFVPGEYEQAYLQLKACPAVAEINLMTHFATADDERGIVQQLQVFERATANISAPISLANSASIIRYPEAHRDWVRPGIMLYGASPVAGTAASSFGLQPVMRLSSEVIAIQTLQAGQGLGYGQQYIAERETRIAVVACGYADGYPRIAPNGTPIGISGQLTQVLGRVSMDMMFADISNLPEVQVGSEVELWGDLVSVDAVAEAAGTVGYELLCAVAPRVQFEVIE